MWKIIAICMIVSLVAAHKATYVNYKVFRIIPTTEAQIEKLHEFQKIFDGVSGQSNDIRNYKREIFNIV